MTLVSFRATLPTHMTHMTHMTNSQFPGTPSVNASPEWIAYCIAANNLRAVLHCFCSDQTDADAVLAAAEDFIAADRAIPRLDLDLS